MAKTRAKISGLKEQEKTIVEQPVWEFKLDHETWDVWKKLDISQRVLKESWVKDQVKLILDYHKCFYFMPSNVGLGVSGIPDFVGCCPNGIFFGVETKRASGIVSAMQWLQLNKINTANGFAVIVDEYGLRDFYSTLIRVSNGSIPAQIYDFRRNKNG